MLKVQLALIFLFAVLSICLILSQDANPDSGPIYGLKRVQENLFLKLKSTPSQQADYESSLLNQRLSELTYIVSNHKYELLLPAASRYSTTAGNLTNLVKSNDLQIEAVKNQFQDHLGQINNLILLCKQNDNSECKYIQDDSNYLILYTQNLTS